MLNEWHSTGMGRCTAATPLIAQRRHSHDDGELCNFPTNQQQWLLHVASSISLRAGYRQKGAMLATWVRHWGCTSPTCRLQMLGNYLLLLGSRSLPDLQIAAELGGVTTC